MAKTGLQNETLISELLISGSSSPAISRNEFGVYSFDQANRTFETKKNIKSSLGIKC